MKLYYSATSPFVRKCLVSAHELKLREQIELLPAAPHPVKRDRALITHNRLGKVRRAGAFEQRIDLGTIAVGCALGYLEFRFASFGWKNSYPKTAAWFAGFAARESMLSTRPPAA